MPYSDSSRHDVLPMQMSDLINRTRRGEPAALAEVYGRYSESLMRLAWRLTGSADDAEDILHDVFVGLPEALRHYDERGSFEPWIKRIIARTALSAIRAKRRSRELSLDDHPLIESSERADSAADSAPIQRAIEALPESLRLVFVLKVMEGHSHAEISAMLGINRGTSEVRLHRAVRALRLALHSDHDDR
ncbi:MAG: sigma-70 family RNA polymerase sigma factor [Gemmatimonadaceae bacterium]